MSDHTHHPGHAHGPHGHQGHDAPCDPTDQTQSFAELLDLDGVVLGDHLAELTAWVRRVSDDQPRRRILDLGAGTGNGTIALAQRFGGAEVIAVDQSEVMLHRIRTKALDLGLAARVRTVRADLATGLPDVDPVDLVWASMMLHEVPDADRLLAEVAGVLRPGGLFVLVEMDAPLRYLPDDLGLGRPGLQARSHAAISGDHGPATPHGHDWTGRLAEAGFGVVAERTFDLHVPPPPSSATGRYAHGWFRRVRSAVDGRLDADDLATLDTLLGDGPEGLQQREDLVVHGSRTAWVVRAV
ncbi:MAG: hypothetical protein JWR90_1190 [Marmoricola sp.]|nr:hypothetical protein [Marmoricola sp.]